MNAAISKVLKLFNILRNPLFARALLKGTAAGTEHRRLLQSLDCRHVIDIGANRGQFALIARKCLPDARIDSFEPLAEPADRFEKIFEKDPHTHLHHFAIGAYEGETTIHVSQADDSSSLLPIGKMQTDMSPGTSERETRTIRVATLDSVLSGQDIRSPALLKLDVQGYELQALQGCLPLLASFKYIYCECSFIELYEGQVLADQVVQFLSSHKFRFIGAYNMCYDKNGIAVQADFLFEKRSSGGTIQN